MMRKFNCHKYLINMQAMNAVISLLIQISYSSNFCSSTSLVWFSSRASGFPADIVTLSGGIFPATLTRSLALSCRCFLPGVAAVIRCPSRYSPCGLPTPGAPASPTSTQRPASVKQYGWNSKTKRYTRILINHRVDFLNYNRFSCLFLLRIRYNLLRWVPLTTSSVTTSTHL